MRAVHGFAGQVRRSGGRPFGQMGRVQGETVQRELRNTPRQLRQGPQQARQRFEKSRHRRQFARFIHLSPRQRGKSEALSFSRKT